MERIVRNLCNGKVRVLNAELRFYEARQLIKATAEPPDGALILAEPQHNRLAVLLALGDYRKCLIGVLRAALVRLR